MLACDFAARAWHPDLRRFDGQRIHGRFVPSEGVNDMAANLQ